MIQLIAGCAGIRHWLRRHPMLGRELSFGEVFVMLVENGVQTKRESKLTARPSQRRGAFVRAILIRAFIG